MRVRLSKWGNDTGIRIQDGMLRELGLTQGAEVELTVSEGEVRIRALRKTSRESLAELIDAAKRVGLEHEPPLLGWGPDRGSVDDRDGGGNEDRLP